jgi:membrane protein YqaA with SNARE-associated domain
LCRKKNYSFYYAAFATVSSVVGGIFGYFIGFVLWDSIGIRLVNWIISEATFNNVVAKYALYQNVAVLIAGFTPVPYKAVTVSAGFCKLSFFPFVGYSLIARGARFYLVAGAIYLWGNQIKDFIDNFFNYLVIAFSLIVILSFSILKG